MPPVPGTGSDAGSQGIGSDAAAKAGAYRASSPNLTPNRSRQRRRQSRVASARPAATASIVPPLPVAGMETNRAPVYPEIARRRGEQGQVMLRVSVSTDGTPLEVDVHDTSGYPSLDSAALNAVRQWRLFRRSKRAHPSARWLKFRFAWLELKASRPGDPSVIASRTRSLVRVTPSLALIAACIGHGLVADAKRIGDFGQARTLGQQPHDLDVALAEVLQPVSGCYRLQRQFLRDFALDVAPALGDAPDRLQSSSAVALLLM